ncbi:MAG: TonB-dependent receptor [Parvularculaceae bacterium]
MLACLTLGCFAVSPAVGDDESEIYAQYIGRSPIGVRRSLALPVDDVLSELSRRLGYSFIFDSRITKGKKVAPLNGLAPAEVALEQSLRGADLSLHKINETTFAIKAAPRIQLAALDAPASVAPAILIDAIVVTATALSKLASPESRHLFLIDDEALAFVVAVNPAEAIYELPQAFASITPSNTALYGATAGLSFADLRGLGPERTLVLVNGRRLALTPGGNGNLAGVDLNAIAEPFLERIEILSAPGGATLGTEAVAGSINFVTKKNISGLEAGAHYGLSQRGDAKEISLYLLGGGSLADGAVSVTGGINATSQAGLIGADREVTSTTWGFDRNGDFLPGYGGSTITPRGSVIGAILDTGEFSGFPSHQFRYSLTGDGGVAPFRGSLDQLHNAAAEQNFIIPVDRLLAYFSVDAEQESNLSFFAEGYFGLTRSKYQLSPLPGVFRGADPLLGDTVAVPVDHPTAPAELNQ